MPVVQRNDPYSSYNFGVEITGISNDSAAVGGSFSEISGLEFEIGVTEYRNGSEDITPRKMPGLVKHTNVVLKRGVTGDIIFWNWIQEGVQGAVNRANGAILLLDENRAEVMRWTLKRCWPSKFTGPSFNSANNEIAMETLELCHEGLELDV